MTSLSGQRTRVADSLTTPGGTGCTAGVDVSCSTAPQQPDATCAGFDVTRTRPMSDFQAIADRVEIEALRGEFTERVYEVRYLDITPLAGSAPRPAGALANPPAGETPTPEGKR
jgi:hypothetical protein